MDGFNDIAINPLKLGLSWQVAKPWFSSPIKQWIYPIQFWCSLFLLFFFHLQQHSKNIYVHIFYSMGAYWYSEEFHQIKFSFRWKLFCNFMKNVSKMVYLFYPSIKDVLLLANRCWWRSSLFVISKINSNHG